jgi:hypothetical protein
MRKKPFVVSFRKIGALMCAPRLFPQPGRTDDGERDIEH